MRHAAALFAIIALVFLSCVLPVAVSDASEQPGEISVAGTWEGTLRTLYGDGKITLRLKQEGNQVTGAYDWDSGRGRGYNIPLQGTISGNALNLTFPTVAFGGIEATVNGDTMTGAYHGTSQRVNEFTATRQVSKGR